MLLQQRIVYVTSYQFTTASRQLATAILQPAQCNEPYALSDEADEILRSDGFFYFAALFIYWLELYFVSLAPFYLLYGRRACFNEALRSMLARRAATTGRHE
jgi:hypothetical protein